MKIAQNYGFALRFGQAPPHLGKGLHRIIGPGEEFEGRTISLDLLHLRVDFGGRRIIKNHHLVSRVLVQRGRLEAVELPRQLTFGVVHLVLQQDVTKEMSRYSRQTLFGPVGQAGQERLAESTVAVVGVGALGSASAELLAALGYLSQEDVAVAPGRPHPREELWATPYDRSTTSTPR